jgi:hypothetical protein
MMITKTANWSCRQIGLGKAAIGVLVGASLLWIAPAAIGADEAITLLQTGKAKYKNVFVTEREGTNIYIRHDGGLANVKIGDLPPDVQQRLGYATSEGDVSSQASRILSRVGKSAAFKIARWPGGATVKVGDFALQLTSADIIGIAVSAAVVYVIFCACSLLLCRKTGREPGLLIWIPILQIIPLLRAAGMSWRWSLTFFVPVLNLVTWMGWCVNIAITRRKSLWWALLLMLPVTNVFAFMYLALSSVDSPKGGSRIVRAARSAPLRATVVQ